MSARRRAPRTRVKRGVYKRCRRGFLGITACPGYYLSKNGTEIRHARCGGDGWIKVGSKGTGRKRRRATGGAAGAAGLWFGLGEWLGTVGYVLAAVILAVVAVLWVLGGIAQATGLVTK